MDGLTKLANFKEFNIDQLVEAPWNYKQDNDEMMAKLIENLKLHGQIENILVRKLDTGFYEVVNGNHRLKAMKSIGATTIIAFDLGPISEARARRIAVETNETKFLTDQVKLAEQYSAMLEEFTREDLAKTSPHSEQEIDNYLKMNEFTFEQFQSHSSSGEAGAATPEEDAIKLKLSPDALEKWNRWKAYLESEGVEVNDYNAFCQAVSDALEYSENHP